MICVFITSTYCPKCQTFVYGKIILPDGNIVSDEKPEYIPYKTLKDVCELSKIPLIDIHVHDIYELSIVPRLIRGVLRRGIISANINKYWIGETLQRPSIELPGLLILSNLTKTRYVSIEIVTEARTRDAITITKYSAVRQCLRNVARTFIEERLVVAGIQPTPERVEYLLSRLFPIDEQGEPNVVRWVRGFIHTKHLRIRG